MANWECDPENMERIGLIIYNFHSISTSMQGTKAALPSNDCSTLYNIVIIRRLVRVRMANWECDPENMERIGLIIYNFSIAGRDPPATRTPIWSDHPHTDHDRIEIFCFVVL